MNSLNCFLIVFLFGLLGYHLGGWLGWFLIIITSTLVVILENVSYALERQGEQGG